MAGSRDDGTFAEDKAHHPNRVVDMNAYRARKASERWEMMRNHPSYRGDSDDANPFGMVRPNMDEVLDDWDTEDVQEQEQMRRKRKNENLGYSENYEGERGY